MADKSSTNANHDIVVSRHEKPTSSATRPSSSNHPPHTSTSSSNNRTTRGQTPNGSIFTKTGFVKAGRSTRYTFTSKGYQELAVVAEAGGLVTMKIHVTNTAGLDQRYDDTKDVKKGRPQRQAHFTLPKDRANTVELVVVNCGQKDCSFVVISN